VSRDLVLASPFGPDGSTGGPRRQAGGVARRGEGNGKGDGELFPVVEVAAGPDPVARTTAFTDGACRGNPGPGGWAWAVPDGSSGSGGEPLTTNQRMELRAVLEAVTALAGPLEIVSDSTYVVNCFRDGWWRAWIAKGWVSSKRQPVANRDLWEPLVTLVRGRDVRFRWVKGHGGDPMNDLVDRMAVAAALAVGPTR
jgi:ribonuclease HI